jgi:hypothetical protein
VPMPRIKIKQRDSSRAALPNKTVPSLTKPRRPCVESTPISPSSAQCRPPRSFGARSETRKGRRRAVVRALSALVHKAYAFRAAGSLPWPFAECVWTGG